MPIWMRRFTFQKIQEWHNKVSEKTKEQPTPSSKQIARPNISPMYSTKASK